jgi:SNF2 family DNA or RNA helicase
MKIGGVRFMWENIVDDLKQYESDEEGFGCILAHAMGLGKTLQVITFVEALLRASPATTALIVVPVNTVSTWNTEFCKWCVTLTSRCSEKHVKRAFVSAASATV